MAVIYSIRTKTNRSKLPPNKEPYWHKISKGRFVGYRKLNIGGTWIARYKSDRKSIGDEHNVDFTKALDLTIEYCNLLDADIQMDYTVQTAIEDYCDNFEIKKNAIGAKKYRTRLNNKLPEKFKQTPVHKLTTKQIIDFRNSIIVKVGDNPSDADIEKQRRSKSSARRILGQVKAVLNFAHKQGIVSSNNAWTRAENFTSSVESARDIFFTDQQVSDILSEAKDPFRVYFKATVLLGTRPGEWADPLVKDFDKVNRTVLIGRKVGKRNAQLSDTTYAFIKEQCKDKLPNAFIFSNQRGNKWRTDVLGAEFNRIAKKLKLPKGSVPYCLRHYFISKGMESDVQILLLARNCGTSIKQIEESYGKFRKSSAFEQLNLIKLAV